MSDINIIQMPVKGRRSYQFTEVELAMFSAFDIFYIDDPALFGEKLRQDIERFSHLDLDETTTAEEKDFQHLIDELSFQIERLDEAKWESFLNAFWVFYEKNDYGLASAKTQIVASLMHMVGDYLQSKEENERLYTYAQLNELILGCTGIVERINIDWVKDKLEDYMEKEVIQVFRLTGMMEEFILDEMLDELDSDMVEEVFLK